MIDLLLRFDTIMHMKIKNKILNHPAVLSIDEEGDEGIWVYLKSGFQVDGCCAIHEFSFRDCCNRLSEIKQLKITIDTINHPR